MRPTIEELRERAAALGVDYDLLHRASRRVLIAMVSLMVVVMGASFIAGDFTDPHSNNLVLGLAIVGVALVIVAVQFGAATLVHRLRPGALVTNVIVQQLVVGLSLVIVALVTRDLGVFAVAAVGGAALAAVIAAGASFRQLESVIRAAPDRAAEALALGRRSPVESSALSGVARWGVLTTVIGTVAHTATMILFLASPLWALVLVPLGVGAAALAWTRSRRGSAAAYVGVLAVEAVVLVLVLIVVVGFVLFGG